MVKNTVQIQMPNGLDTRPIAMLVQVASQYRSQIHLSNGNKTVNAKSIMGMMTLGLDNGETVTITAEGADEADALKSLQAYLTQEKKK